MANLITLSRLLLLILVVVIAYQPPAAWQLIDIPLLILVFVTDGLDGYIARKRGEVSLFGAMFDIAGDRIVELTMWMVLADLDMVPIWVPLVFVIRGVIVDTIRAGQATEHGQSPFAAIRTGIGRWLVAGQFMRIFYAVLKATAFCWMLLLYSLPAAFPAIWEQWRGLLEPVGAFLVYLSVTICIVRAFPVVVEFVYAERATIVGSLSRGKGGRG